MSHIVRKFNVTKWRTHNFPRMAKWNGTVTNGTPGDVLKNNTAAFTLLWQNTNFFLLTRNARGTSNERQSLAQTADWCSLIQTQYNAPPCERWHAKGRIIPRERKSWSERCFRGRRAVPQCTCQSITSAHVRVSFAIRLLAYRVSALSAALIRCKIVLDVFF